MGQVCDLNMCCFATHLALSLPSGQHSWDHELGDASQYGKVAHYHVVTHGEGADDLVLCASEVLMFAKLRLVY